eukprot:GFYU01006665.1.p1 GENE.GFYU01006665.1~~GFYU01006665.1.p1  ORF type:complete len:506 (+),score=81.77 GFYU01006665.1:152-1669(+)
MMEPTEEVKLSRWSLVGISLLAIPIEFGWGIAEGLIVPYITGLGVSPGVSALIWLINPIFGVILGPYIGRLSDSCTFRWGRRRIFILVLTIGILLGTVMLCYGRNIAGGREDSTKNIVLAFVSFGIVDMCHDLLIIPSRSLMNDVTTGEQKEHGNALLSATGSMGRCLSMFIGSLEVEKLPLLDSLGSPLHFRACLAISMITLLVCNLAGMLSVKEIPLEKNAIQSINDDEFQGDTYYVALDSSPTAISTTERRSSTEDLDDSASTGTNAFHRREGESTLDLLKRAPKSLIMLYLVQTGGWIATMSPAFFFTFWMANVVYGAEPNTPEFDDGVLFGMKALAGAALLSFVWAWLLPSLNNTLGVDTSFYLHQMYLGWSLIALVIFQDTNKYVLLAIMATTGIPYAVLNDNPYLILEKEIGDDEKVRGMAIGTLSACMPMAQILLSIANFVYLQLLGLDAAYIFLWPGVLLVIVCIVPFFNTLVKAIRSAVARGYRMVDHVTSSELA